MDISLLKTSPLTPAEEWLQEVVDDLAAGTIPLRNKLSDPTWDEDDTAVVDDVDVVAVKFVLDEIIDFLETLKLSGKTLKEAGRLLRDVEELRVNL